MTLTFTSCLPLSPTTIYFFIEIGYCYKKTDTENLHITKIEQTNIYLYFNIIKYMVSYWSHSFSADIETD